MFKVPRKIKKEIVDMAMIIDYSTPRQMLYDVINEVEGYFNSSTQAPEYKRRPTIRRNPKGCKKRYSRVSGVRQ